MAGYLEDSRANKSGSKRAKMTAPKIIQMKSEGKKIAALTAYDYTIAALEDKAGMDIILVGDSAANVIAGHKDTLSISLDEMVYMTKWVRCGTRYALLVADMPFGSYQVSKDKAVESAIRFIKEGGAEAVKVEGASEDNIDFIRRLIEIGVPVMGHIGLTPQSVNIFGGFGLQGVDSENAERIFQEAIQLDKAGCFSIVLEKIPVALAKKITEKISIPTIGIASGPYCDGQILVSYDMLGLGPNFKFARHYLEGKEVLSEAFKNYIDDIKKGDFPTEEESYES